MTTIADIARPVSLHQRIPVSPYIVAREVAIHLRDGIGIEDMAVRYGIPEDQSRALIAKWRRRYRLKAIMGVV